MRKKVYKLDKFGYAQMILDSRQEKINKINGRISLVLIILLFAIGVIGKEMLIIMIGNMTIGKVTNWLLG